jgi:hypothetical protein
VFFLISYRRGDILCSKMSENDKKPACKALALNCKCVLRALDDTMNNDLENCETKRDARSLMKKMRKRETALLC